MDSSLGTDTPTPVNDGPSPQQQFNDHLNGDWMKWPALDLLTSGIAQEILEKQKPKTEKLLQEFHEKGKSRRYDLYRLARPPGRHPCAENACCYLPCLTIPTYCPVGLCIDAAHEARNGFGNGFETWWFSRPSAWRKHSWRAVKPNAIFPPNRTLLGKEEDLIKEVLINSLDGQKLVRSAKARAQLLFAVNFMVKNKLNTELLDFNSTLPHCGINARIKPVLPRNTNPVSTAANLLGLCCLVPADKSKGPIGLEVKHKLTPLVTDPSTSLGEIRDAYEPPHHASLKFHYGSYCPLQDPIETSKDGQWELSTVGSYNGDAPASLEMVEPLTTLAYKAQAEYEAAAKEFLVGIEGNLDTWQVLNDLARETAQEMVQEMGPVIKGEKNLRSFKLRVCNRKHAPWGSEPRVTATTLLKMLLNKRRLNPHQAKQYAWLNISTDDEAKVARAFRQKVAKMIPEQIRQYREQENMPPEACKHKPQISHFYGQPTTGRMIGIEYDHYISVSWKPIHPLVWRSPHGK